MAMVGVQLPHSEIGKEAPANGAFSVLECQKLVEHAGGKTEPFCRTASGHSLAVLAVSVLPLVLLVRFCFGALLKASLNFRPLVVRLSSGDRFGLCAVTAAALASKLFPLVRGEVVFGHTELLHKFSDRKKS